MLTEQPHTSVEGSASPVAEVQIQSLFRDVNERALPVSSSFENVEVICECADASCFQVLTLRRDHYEAIRQSPTRFVVASGHTTGLRELVIPHSEGISVVEKVGAAAAPAERLDPRARKTFEARSERHERERRLVS